jgi:hypothetical protein
MSKSYVKLVPDKDVTNVILPEILSFDSKTLVMSVDSNGFVQGDLFDVVLEEGNKLKFLKVVLNSIADEQFSFDVQSTKDVIKREYERSSVLLNVGGNDFKGQTINISAGGMQVKSRQALQEGSVYDLKIYFDVKELDVKYEVLRARQDKKTYFISGKFVDIDNETKAFIIQQNLKNKIFGIKSSPIGQMGG